MSIVLITPVDGEIATWHKKPGDFVKVNENIVDIECGESVYEVTPPNNGILKEALVKAGTKVTANQAIGVFEVRGFKSRLVATLKNFIKRK